MLCCGKGKVHRSVKVLAFRTLLAITISIIQDRVHLNLLREFQNTPSSSTISSGASFLRALNIASSTEKDTNTNTNIQQTTMEYKEHTNDRKMLIVKQCI